MRKVKELRDESIYDALQACKSQFCRVPLGYINKMGNFYEFTHGSDCEITKCIGMTDGENINVIWNE